MTSTRPALLGDEARKHKVMTQMGNQGHGGDGIRRLREYLEAGAIGTVTEVHSWQDQRYGTRIRHPDCPGAGRRPLGRVAGTDAEDSLSPGTGSLRGRPE